MLAIISRARGNTMMTSIYNQTHLDELRSYTIRLLNLLEAHGCLENSGFDDFKKKYICSETGKVHFDGANNQVITPKKTLEFLTWNGKNYYYCSEDSTLYTHEHKPVKIGYFDYDAMTPVVV